MSEEKHEGCNCTSQPISDEQLLANQAEAKANLAYTWLYKDRIDVAEVHLQAAAKLLKLSGIKECAGMALYSAARAAIAQKRGQNKAALRHSRKAYSISKDLYPAHHYSIALAQANYGEMVATVVDKEKGLAIMTAGLELLKAADVGTAKHMLDWKENAVKEITATMAGLG